MCIRTHAATCHTSTCIHIHIHIHHFITYSMRQHNSARRNARRDWIILKHPAHLKNPKLLSNIVPKTLFGGSFCTWFLQERSQSWEVCCHAGSKYFSLSPYRVEDTCWPICIAFKFNFGLYPNWTWTRKEPEQNQQEPELNQNLTRTNATFAMSQNRIEQEPEENQNRTRTEPAEARIKSEHTRTRTIFDSAWTRKEPEQNQPKPELNQNLTRTNTTFAMTSNSIEHETHQKHAEIQLLKHQDRTECFLFCPS